VPQLRQRLRLDLADPLARDAELLADLFKSPDASVVEPKSQAHDLLLAIVQLLQRLLDCLAQQPARSGGRRSDGARIFDEVAEEAVVFLPYRRLE